MGESVSTILSATFEVVGRTEDGRTYASVSGVIDESFDPNQLVSLIKAPVVFIDLQGVRRLSSFGVRELTRTMRLVCEKAEEVYLVQLAPAIVSQLNVVANLCASARILSVDAPYFCDSCGYDQTVAVEFPTSELPQLPNVTCRECGSQMALDDDADSYFAGVRNNAYGRPVAQSIFDGAARLGAVRMGRNPSQVDVSGIVSALPEPSFGSSEPNPSRYVPKASSSDRLDLRLVGMAIAGSMLIAVFFIAAFWGRAVPPVMRLSDADRADFRQHVRTGAPHRAAALVNVLEEQKRLAPEHATALREQLALNLENSVSKYLDGEEFEGAARMLISAAEQRVLSPYQADRAFRMVADRAQVFHRDLIAKEAFEDARKLSETLLRPGLLPISVRRRLAADLDKDRLSIVDNLKADVLGAFARKDWRVTLDGAQKIASILPLDRELEFIVAESHRELGDVEEAELFYSTFISHVEHDDPPAKHLDAALFWRAEFFARSGQLRQARPLYRRVAAMAKSPFRRRARRALRRRRY